VTCDPFDLDRFVSAQDQGGTYERAVSELRGGLKRSHWMWFVFPQIAGLGQSSTSQRYAISSLDEAHAYLKHPILGPRLLECSRIVAASTAPSAEQIFGGIDTQKLRSSMTLFAQASPNEQAFSNLLDRFFGGEADPATKTLLGPERSPDSSP
jgi:uncharacterized protein (DUF1810 family)